MATLRKQLPRHRYSFRSLDYKRDPITTFSTFRASGDVIRMKLPIFGDGWAATSYEAANRVMKDDHLFVRDPKNAGRRTMGKIQWILPRSLMALSNNMIAKDGASHRRLRGLVDQAFARRNVAAMSARMEELAVEQLSAAQRVADQTGQVDLVEHFARPFPLTVICELLGMPLEDRPAFRKWFAPLSNISGLGGLLQLGRCIRRISRYLEGQFEEVRRQPREGLMSELVAVRDGTDSLADDELLSMVFMLFFAGHETTVHLITNSVVALCQEPGVRQALLREWIDGPREKSNTDSDTKSSAAKRDRERVEVMFVEEVLRHYSPIQIGKPRWVKSDVVFFDRQLQRGEMIMPLIAAANGDPAQFEHPERFDLHRHPNYHLTFGSGPHTCLGMTLARNETLAALRALLSAWPGFQLVGDLSNLDWSRRPGMRGLRSLVVAPA